MDLPGAALAQHLHHRTSGGAPHDRVIDQDDTLAAKNDEVGVMLKLDPLMLHQLESFPHCKSGKSSDFSMRLLKVCEAF